jgi:hypothetical protein
MDGLACLLLITTSRGWGGFWTRSLFLCLKPYVFRLFLGERLFSPISQTLSHPACRTSQLAQKETGVTLTEYQQKRRIEEAKILLKTDHAPIGWIGGHVGFDDAGYFTRIFKKLEGMTPSEYRNSDSNRIMLED